MSKKINWLCNDCERGFVNRAAWEHHGAQTGHNINGDLPGKQQREVSELRAALDAARVAADANRANFSQLLKDRDRLQQKLNMVASTLAL